MVSQFSPTATPQRTQRTLQHTGELLLDEHRRNTPFLPPSTAQVRHLHPLDGVGRRVGPVDEMRVLHVLRQPLQEAQGLVKYHGHGDL